MQHSYFNKFRTEQGVFFLVITSNLLPSSLQSTDRSYGFFSLGILGVEKKIVSQTWSRAHRGNIATLSRVRFRCFLDSGFFFITTPEGKKPLNFLFPTYFFGDQQFCIWKTTKPSPFAETEFKVRKSSSLTLCGSGFKKWSFFLTDKDAIRSGYGQDKVAIRSR